MKQVVLLTLLLSPLLYSAYNWFKEEYLLTGKALSCRQYILLATFAGYSGYCIYVGIDTMLLNTKDYTYQAGRALSFSGLWTFVLPGFIAPMIIFPRETLLYVFKKAIVHSIEQSVFAALGWLLLLLTLIRHIAVI